MIEEMKAEHSLQSRILHLSLVGDPHRLAAHSSPRTAHAPHALAADVHELRVAVVDGAAAEDFIFDERMFEI